MDKKDTRFAPFYNNLDHHYHKFRIMNIGAQAKHAQILTKEEEALLWETSHALLITIIFLNGKKLLRKGRQRT